MSHLEKLLIQGIRSFSPDDSSTIEFFSPVTMIVGPNGSGKTTIIEALKYVITGEFPPGGEKGKAFVHDTAMANKREVDGRIKLRMINAQGREIICTRHVRLTQAPTTKTFKTIKTDISYRKRPLPQSDDPNENHTNNDTNAITDGSGNGYDGEFGSVTRRCIDIDMEMVRHLGVSSAVANYVIFCHQEEANWPLSSDPLKLKEKFDMIFSAARHSKALENIKKLRKEQAAQYKDNLVDLERAKGSKGKANELRVKMTTHGMKLKEIDTQVEEVDAEIAPTRDERNHIETRLKRYTSIKQSVEVKSEVLSQLKNQLEDMLAHLETKNNGDISTIDQLMHLIDKNNKDISASDRIHKQATMDLDAQIKEIQRLQASIKQVEEEKTTATIELKNLDLALNKRKIFLSELLHLINNKELASDRHVYSDSDRITIIHEVDKTIKTLRLNIAKISTAHHEKEDALINSYKKTDAKIESAKLMIAHNTSKIAEARNDHSAKSTHLHNINKEIQALANLTIKGQEKIDLISSDNNIADGVDEDDSSSFLEFPPNKVYIESKNNTSPRQETLPSLVSMNDILANINNELEDISKKKRDIIKEDESFVMFHPNLSNLLDNISISSNANANNNNMSEKGKARIALPNVSMILPTLDSMTDLNDLMTDLTKNLGNLHYVKEKKSFFERLTAEVDKKIELLNSEMKLLTLQGDTRAQISEWEKTCQGLQESKTKLYKSLKEDPLFIGALQSHYTLQSQRISNGESQGTTSELDKLEGLISFVSSPNNSNSTDNNELVDFFDHLKLMRDIIRIKKELLDKSHAQLSDYTSKVYNMEQKIKEAADHQATERLELANKKNKLSQLCNLNNSESAINSGSAFTNQFEDDEFTNMSNNQHPLTSDSLDYSDYEKVLASSKEEYEEILNDLKMIESGQLFYQKYKKIADTKKCCPLCEADFNSDPGSLRAFKEKIQAQLDKIPSRLNTIKREKEAREKKMYSLSQSRGLYDEISKMSIHQLPALEDQMAKYKAESQSLVMERDKLKSTIDVIKEELEKCHTYLQKLEKLDEYTQEFLAKQSRIENESKNLHHYTQHATMNECLKLVELETRKKDMMLAKVNEFTNIIIDLNNCLNKYKTRESSLIAQVDKVKSNFAKQDEIKTELDILINKITTLENEVSQLEKQIPSLSFELDQINKKIQECKSEFQEEVEKKKEFLEKIRHERDKFQSHNNLIEETSRRNYPEKLASISLQLEKILESHTAREKEKSKLEEQVREAGNMQGKLESQNKMYNQHITAIQKKQEYDAKAKELHDLRQELSKIDYNFIVKSREQLEQKSRILSERKHQMLGSKQQLESIIQQIMSELEDKNLKDAEKNFSEKEIMARALNHVSSDLDKFYKALDQSIMQYHKIKMDEINKIIKEMWANTYTGSDIDTIEIRSEVSTAGDTNIPTTGRGLAGVSLNQNRNVTDTTMRRVYNYRVVMVKGGAELDMRGRCSAGQKVLASLIIRLALAETFCSNCGILTLDEPTSNLDHENVERLALSLAGLINLRKTSSKFQLVIITHDEDFVNLLARNGCLDKYWRVSRNESQHSQILKQTCHNLT